MYNTNIKDNIIAKKEPIKQLATYSKIYEFNKRKVNRYSSSIDTNAKADSSLVDKCKITKNPESNKSLNMNL